MRQRRRAAALTVTLIISACGGGNATSDTGDPTTTAPAVTSAPATTSPPATTAAPTTAAAQATTAAPTTTVPPFTRTNDVIYMTVDGVDLHMDVYQPVDDGPWPMVVTFHGLSTSQKSDLDTTSVAKEAAAQGFVVFVPSWFHANPEPMTIDKFLTAQDVTNCALAFAQANAATYGGDTARTVVDGFSAGAIPVLSVSLERVDAPISGCGTDTAPIPPVGAVLGDGDHFLHTGFFDDVFESDTAAMQDELADWLVASNWPDDLATEFYLWTADTGTNPRRIGEPGDESKWPATRDPDGSILADLQRLGLSDDDIVTYVDGGRFLNLRLSEGGIKVTLDEYPGEHTTRDKLNEIVGYFLAATAG